MYSSESMECGYFLETWNSNVRFLSRTLVRIAAHGGEGGLFKVNDFPKQECIPVGCVPPAR